MERLTHTHAEDTSELLSALVDGAVDVVERRRAEGYLEQCAGCAQELRELRLVKSMLHDLPLAQPRRSFTLDPASAPRPRRLLFPTLRLATFATAVLLLLVLGIDGLAVPGSGSIATTAAPAAEMQSRQLQAPPSAQDSAAATGAQPESAAAPPAASAESAAAMIAPEASAMPEAAAEAPPERTMMALESQFDEPSSAAAALPEAAGGGVTTDEPAAADTVQLKDQEAAQAGGPSFDTLLIIELLLAVVAIGFGVGAYVTWRRQI